MVDLAKEMTSRRPCKYCECRSFDLFFLLVSNLAQHLKVDSCLLIAW